MEKSQKSNTREVNKMTENKKEIVLGTGKKKSYRNLVLIGLAVLIVIGGYLYLKPNNSSTGAAISSGLEPMDYRGIRVDIVDVQAVEQENSVGISLDDLNKYKLVHFTYESKPLMAYIDNKGNVITAIAMCEPCRNNHDFFIQDNILVCAKCWTKWKLTSHSGISGGCKKYAPEILGNQIIDNKVFVNKQDVVEWIPRE